MHNKITQDDLTLLHGNQPIHNGPHGDQALLKMIELGLNKDPFVMLDLGSAGGRHAKLFQKCGAQVETIDLNPKHKTTYCGDFLYTAFPYQFDGIWCNHCLEHQTNPGLFLKKMLSSTKEEGIVAITVPKACYRDPPHKIVSGHVTMWNAGLLLYNMILAGFDCADAHVKTYGYNVSVVCKVKPIASMPAITMQSGDIERLAKYFPMEVFQGFDGDIAEANW